MTDWTNFELAWKKKKCLYLGGFEPMETMHQNEQLWQIFPCSRGTQTYAHPSSLRVHPVAKQDIRDLQSGPQLFMDTPGLHALQLICETIIQMLWPRVPRLVPTQLRANVISKPKYIRLAKRLCSRVKEFGNVTDKFKYPKAIAYMQ